MSKGAQQLLEIVQSIFPNQTVVKEYNIADRGALFLDIFLPHLNIAFEYDGRQHYEYNEHFHGSREAFLAAKKRDVAKTIACEQNDITLVRIRYDDPMTREFILERIDEALDG